jgi:diguanylate cyclase (GGDEF)-like protein
MALTWEKHGPRADERVLAGKTAGALWLSVLPMVVVALLLPGAADDHWGVVLAATIPAAAWGLACLLWVPWERVSTPLVFHAPSLAAVPFIGVLVAATGGTHSVLVLTPLMLLVFCAYFYPPSVAIGYIVACVGVLAVPLAYEADAVRSGVIGQIWVATCVYASVGGVVMVGKRQLLALRDAAQDLSLRDSLTGLMNRRALDEVLERHDAETRRKEAVGFMLIDLDNFKEVNTRYGMQGGDLTLCAVAGALQSIARDEQLVVRLGGDEFAIVAEGLPPQAMERLADRALEAVRQSLIDVELPGLHVSASAGWAVCPHDADTAGELVGVADLALRAAKLDGKERAHGPLEWASRAAL